MRFRKCLGPFRLPRAESTHPATPDAATRGCRLQSPGKVLDPLKPSLDFADDRYRTQPTVLGIWDLCLGPSLHRQFGPCHSLENRAVESDLPKIQSVPGNSLCSCFFSPF